MPHSLRDLQSSPGYRVVMITATDALRDGQWLTIPVCVVENLVGASATNVSPFEDWVALHIAEDLREEASQLWPDIDIKDPDNSRVVTTQ